MGDAVSASKIGLYLEVRHVLAVPDLYVVVLLDLEYLGREGLVVEDAVKVSLTPEPGACPELRGAAAHLNRILLRTSSTRRDQMTVPIVTIDVIPCHWMSLIVVRVIKETFKHPQWE